MGSELGIGHGTENETAPGNSDDDTDDEKQQDQSAGYLVLSEGLPSHGRPSCSLVASAHHRLARAQRLKAAISCTEKTPSIIVGWRILQHQHRKEAASLWCALYVAESRI